MDSRHKIIKDKFFSVFENNGLKKFPSASLLTDDKSVYFTCATITPLKNFIINGNIPKKGLYIYQPCLRLNSLNDSFERKGKADFPGYFNMLGTFTPAQDIESFQNKIIECFSSQGVSSDNVRIYAPSSNNSLVSILKNTYDVEFDSKEPRYYKWTYGLGDDVGGIGATFSLKQKDGSFDDIGQYVGIFAKGKLVGCEFGFGIETFLSRHLQYENYYDAYSIASILEKNGLESNFVNVNIFETAVSAYSTGISSDNCPDRGYKKQLSRILTNLVILKNKENLSDEQMTSVFYEFAEIEFGKTSFIENLQSDFGFKDKEFDRELKNLNDFEQNQLKLGKDTGQIAQRAETLYPLAIKYNKISGR